MHPARRHTTAASLHGRHQRPGRTADVQPALEQRETRTRAVQRRDLPVEDHRPPVRRFQHPGSELRESTCHIPAAAAADDDLAAAHVRQRTTIPLGLRRPVPLSGRENLHRNGQHRLDQQQTTRHGQAFPPRDRPRPLRTATAVAGPERKP